ncbi:MAG: hypothetical protein AVDCRST_MAG10-3445 [uncultured Acidimicrobiales bacterium]|uniref:Uncharacterized protein n=1 Tax=uncultured Acidimicrobiales bacterium TaxID=310071 RepID=A0A6J4JCB2_9ACTN|nr:MAG: hypothetical protein AVDCRST_MAG10-3445 [uncultured Acidimicrobiales bacterium]
MDPFPTPEGPAMTKICPLRRVLRCVGWRLSADCVRWRLSADCVRWRLSADCVRWRLSAD